MNNTPINFKNELSQLNSLWSPHLIAEMNDYQFKLVKVLGEFIWHSHTHTDEAFIILNGSLTIQFRDEEINLSSGEMFVIPKGVEHKPVAKNECHMMLIEPKGTASIGDENE